MALYPRYGERYQHKSGWTVYILGMIYRDKLIDINPEFSREVRFIYENSGEYTEMPLSWFNEVYRKISDNSKYLHNARFPGGYQFPDYSWLDDDDE